MGYLRASRIYVTEKRKQKLNFFYLKSFLVFTDFYLEFNFNVTKNQLVWSLKIRCISMLTVFLHAFTQRRSAILTFSSLASRAMTSRAIH